MKRAFSLLAHATNALGRRRGRSIGLVLALALVCAAIESVSMVSGSLRAELTRGSAATPHLVVQSLVGGRPALVADAALDALARRPGVRTVAPRVFGYLFLPSVEANLTVVGIEASRAPRSVRALTGRLPRAPGEVAVGAVLADALGLRIGDVAALPVTEGFASFRVVGVFQADTALRTADLALVTIGDARRLLAIPEGSATDIAVELTTEDESAVVAREIRELLPTARVLEKQNVARTHALTIGARSGLALVMLLPALLCLLLLGWDRLTGLDETERRELAVLKIVGWSTSDVLLVRALESVLLSVVGATLGFVAAYVFVFPLEAPLLGDALFGWSRLVPRLVLVPDVHVVDVLQLFGLVVVPFVLVSVVPAYLAAMTDPTESWRR